MILLLTAALSLLTGFIVGALLTRRNWRIAVENAEAEMRVANARYAIFANGRRSLLSAHIEGPITYLEIADLAPKIVERTP